jgi:hypothetical protein
LSHAACFETAQIVAIVLPGSSLSAAMVITGVESCRQKGLNNLGPKEPTAKEPIKKDMCSEGRCVLTNGGNKYAYWTMCVVCKWKPEYYARKTTDKADVGAKTKTDEEVDGDWQEVEVEDADHVQIIKITSSSTKVIVSSSSSSSKSTVELETHRKKKSS